MDKKVLVVFLAIAFLILFVSDLVYGDSGLPIILTDIMDHSDGMK